jgi:hypothetical protein
VPSPDILKPDVPKPAAAGPAVVEPVVIAQPPSPEPVMPTPGEFDVEAALDPVHEALDDIAARPLRAAAAAEPSLFDDQPVERFAFLEEEEEEETARQEDMRDEAEPVNDESPVEAAMFHTREPEVGLADTGDQGRPAILPYAVVSVLMLLIGFAGGYFVGSRDRLSRSEETREAADTTKSSAAPAPTVPPRNATASSGAATPEKPGQYSEQKVTRSAAPVEGKAPGAAVTASPAAPVTARPAPAAAAKGQIVVRSLPSHAGVTVNGTWRGRTPLTLDDVAFGNYVVRIVQPGYRVAREDFTLNAREPSRTITTRLERAGPAPAPAAPAAAPPPAFTGSLYVDSRPRGAAVFVDGRSAGQTPLTLSDMTAGSHVVRIEMDGKKTVTATPRIVAGQMERVTVSLEDRQNAPEAGPRASEGRR